MRWRAEADPLDTRQSSQLTANERWRRSPRAEPASRSSARRAGGTGSGQMGSTAGGGAPELAWGGGGFAACLRGRRGGGAAAGEGFGFAAAAAATPGRTGPLGSGFIMLTAGIEAADGKIDIDGDLVLAQPCCQQLAWRSWPGADVGHRHVRRLRPQRLIAIEIMLERRVAQIGPHAARHRQAAPAPGNSRCVQPSRVASTWARNPKRSASSERRSGDSAAIDHPRRHA